MESATLRLALRSALPLLALGLSGCGQHVERAAAAAREPVAVAVAAARPAAEHALYDGPGVVRAAHTYRVAFEIAGRVESVAADVGDRVAAGAPLATIDASAYGDELAGAAAHADAMAALARRADAGSRPQERAEATAQVAAANAALARAAAAAELARENDARTRSLLGSGYIAAQQADLTRTAVDDTAAAVSAARAQLATARESAALVEAGPRSEDRANAAAEARAARAGAAELATTIRKATIHAPEDAIVESRDIEPGNDAVPGAVAFTLVDAGPPDIVVDVPESRAAGIEAGTSATVRDAAGARAAAVTRVEPSASDASRTYAVRVRLRSGRLRLGSVVEVALGTASDAGTRIGVESLVRRDGRTYAEVLDGTRTRVAFRPVRVLRMDGTDAVVGGVRPGERVVAMGAASVDAGDAVRVVTAGADR